MMRVPSVRTIETRLSLDKSTALALRRLLDGRADPEGYASVSEWVRQCYNRPRRSEMVMLAANEILRGHGTEVIRGSEWLDAYHGDIRAEYVNMGDTYTATLLLDHATGRYEVCSWGDWLETQERRGERFE